MSYRDRGTVREMSLQAARAIWLTTRARRSRRARGQCSRTRKSLSNVAIRRQTFRRARVFNVPRLLHARDTAPRLIDYGVGDGEVGFAGAARFFEKNGSTFRSIRSRTRLVWSP